MRIAAQRPPIVDISDVDPLAPRYKEWAERAAKLQDGGTASAPRPCRSAATGFGRDVLAKAMKGTADLGLRRRARGASSPP